MAKIVTLGEIMLRLSSTEGIRLTDSKQLAAHYGGGEANVAISLANYGHQVAYASKVPDNSLGTAVSQHLRKFGVNTAFLLKGGPRLGTYYMETGIGERAAAVIYDRVGSSFAEMKAIEWDTDALFDGVEIFHISGITPALSPTWQLLTLSLIKEAREKGCKISFDINYRGKLWTQAQASIVLQQILPYVDYLSAGKLDALHLLGIPASPENTENDLLYYYQEIKKMYPNIHLIYSTKRTVQSASTNLLIGTLFIENKYYESQLHEISPIVDRVGGGDAFAGGVIHGLLSNWQPQNIISFATAASALKHTIHGDCNQFTETEVSNFLAAGSGKIVR
ncbi:PfkB family carbohydrate kinase [Enterococcus sp. LJL90]